MSDINYLIWGAISIFVSICLAYVAIDQYRLWRNRRWDGRYASGIPGMPAAPPTEVPRIDLTGELTTNAKYVIWQYMFSILAVGGVVIGILSGVAGYMIKDLATAGAIQAALNKMQEPLAEQFKNFATAKASLDAATEKVKNDAEFVGKVGKAIESSVVEALRPKVAQELFDKHANQLVKAISTDLALNHKDELRGMKGDKGENGTNGAEGKLGPKGDKGDKGDSGTNGTNGNEGKPGAKGDKGDKGDSGMNGTNGAEGKPGAKGDKGDKGESGTNGTNGLEGKPGSKGEIGAKGDKGEKGEMGAKGDKGEIGVKGGAGEIGVKGDKGDKGDNGTNGVDGQPGVSPELGKIAEQVANQYREQLRGPPGTNGTNGINGQSPSVADVASSIWENHGDELRRPPQPKPQPQPTKRKGSR